MKRSSLVFITAMLVIILCRTILVAQTNSFLKKYAGTYHMLVDGQQSPATPDKYVLTAEGKCEWTMTFQNEAGKTEVKRTPGTWSASDGFIQVKFDMGEGEGSELVSDFHLKNGVFHSNENVYLKKVTPAASKAKAKPKS